MNTVELQYKRTIYNLLIRDIINLHMSIYPNIRFIQHLWCLNIIDESNNEACTQIEIVDRYSEEPWETVRRILPKIKTNIIDNFPQNASDYQKILQASIIGNLTDMGFSLEKS